MNNFEKLGAFYLGKNYDVNTKKITDDLLLYDSKDLTTHAVCVGMTGSGKTGLCVSLLEEAAIDNVPSLVIDPKGDITNLMLTFPELKGENFLPWINKSDAKRKGITDEEFAEQQAKLWKNGLKKWGQDGKRIAKLKDSAKFDIYTPGSNAGLSISILDSFKAPSQAAMDDRDLFNDKISSTVSSLLGLLGIDADPLQSKEHILLSNILKHSWAKSENLDLPQIILNVQSPPFQKIGVFDLESFYPETQRMKLAMQLNNILSAPAFQSWLTGEPLDIDKLLYTGNGKPKVSIFYTAHLSESERMFFTSLLLNQLLDWMRQQSGTTSLRALLYVDEIFGYLPPVANPPTKKPFLTLLKQARAFGLGLVLATQNPADLDYKSLSNAGTWFLGRLQTERDRKRVLDGLEGASTESGSTFNRKQINTLLSNLGKRVFLLHNVHEEHPQVFHTRWAMSYLRGPLTRTQIKTVVKKETKRKASDKSTSSIAPVESIKNISINSLPKSVKPLYLKREIDDSELSEFKYSPFIVAQADVRFYERTKKIDVEENPNFIIPITDDVISVNWDESFKVDFSKKNLLKKAKTKIEFTSLPLSTKESKNFTAWEKQFKDYLANDFTLEVFHSPILKQTSKPYESSRDFSIRLAQLTREKRDGAVTKLKDKYARRTQTIEGRIRRAKDKIAREKSQSSNQKLQSVISIGSTILGALFGSKKLSTTTFNKAGRAIKSAGRAMKESGDVNRAEENLLVLQQQLEELQDKFQDEVNTSEDKFDLSVEQLETLKFRPKKTNINVKLFNFVWVPLANENIEDIPELEVLG
ncbi:MAG: ATP-binding protein [Ignavibacteriae bacterium]|nr:ATP-binding protein [Ignavibacteriota bacterium]